MGVETLLFAGMLGQAYGQISAAKKEAKALVAQGEIEAKNKAKQVKYGAASLTSSFLNSGITLDGSPMAAIMGYYENGLEDINAYRASVNAKSKSVISAGRSKAIGTLMSAAAMSAGGFGGMGAPESLGTIGGYQGSIPSAFGGVKPSGNWGVTGTGGYY